MSAFPDSPPDSSTDALSDEVQKLPDGSDANKWEVAMDTVNQLVKRFLATRGITTLDDRGNVVFEDLSVQGSGNGVRHRHECQLRIFGAESICAGPSRRYRSNLCAICFESVQPSLLSKKPSTFPSLTQKFQRHHCSRGDVACCWEARQWLHYLPENDC